MSLRSKIKIKKTLRSKIVTSDQDQDFEVEDQHQESLRSKFEIKTQRSKNNTNTLRSKIKTNTV